MNIYYLILLFFICLQTAFAQRVTNVRAQAKGNIVTISYDLLGTLSGQLYTVSVYSSHNGMSAPLSQVKGEIGPDIKPGTNKLIEWGAKKELSDFEGDITFEVRATLTFSPMRFTAPQKNALHKRGKSYKLTWMGAVANENLQLELYNDTTRVLEIGRTQNKGNLEWELPLNIAPGKTYKYKISSVEKPGNFAYSNTFIVKRKTPTWVKVVPAAGILAGVIYYIISRDGDTPSSPAEETDLPLPPNPE